MNNASKPAYPVEYASKERGGVTSYESAKGLTKRERFAIAAMQGLLSNPDASHRIYDAVVEGKYDSFSKAVAEFSTGYADALLKALEE